MNVLNSIVFIMFVTSILAGCGSTPSFTEGLAAIDRKDFATASYHFAELSKEGDPGSMNNLGVSLLMIGRKDEAVYWLKKASRYGESNAKSTLKAMGEYAPPSDLVGQHPTQLQREATKRFVEYTLLGVAIGVTAYYASKGTAKHSSSHSPDLNATSQNRKNQQATMHSRSLSLDLNELDLSNSLSFDRNRLELGHKNDNEYPYESFSGTSYKYDLTNPIDRINYEVDPASQVFDSVNPMIEIDRGQGQFGGGARR